MDKIPYLLIDNFFTGEELDLIWPELDFLNNPFLLKKPAETGSAFTGEGTLKKNNKGVFLGDVYRSFEISSVWRLSSKLEKGYIQEYSELHLANKSILSANYSSMLLSYYEDSDFYLPHRDTAIATVLYWFYREPKKFNGGDLVFTDTNEVVEVKNDRMIMFPSWATHAVTEVTMAEEFRNQKLGRYCLTQFLLVRTD